MTEVNKPNFLDKVRSMINGNAENYEHYEEEMEEMVQEADNFDLQEVELTNVAEEKPAPVNSSLRRQNRNKIQSESSSSETAMNNNNHHYPNNVIGMPGVNSMVHEIVFLEPHNFQQMTQVIEILKQQKTVVLNFTVMDAYEAQRAVDFVAGGAFAMDGHQKRIGDGIFLFTPRNVNVNDNMKINLDGSEDKSFNPTMGLTDKFPDSLWDTPSSDLPDSMAQ
ncbi:MAG: cell division protein SepF [Cyanobacterium sp. T60_A2020_053]|nr:cell division protein SepF [Cyanobacterium sp. T60_A2020_053]